MACRWIIILNIGIPIWSSEQAVWLVVPAIVELHGMPSAVSLGHIICSTNDIYVCSYLQCSCDVDNTDDNILLLFWLHN